MPALGLTTQATVSKIIDGDTIEVEVKHKLRVRMLNLWCPEMNTKEGKAAKLHLNNLVPIGSSVVLHIPCNKDGDLSPLFTFSRVLGLVFKEEQDISELMVNAGHGKPKKNFIERLKSEGFDYEATRRSIFYSSATTNEPELQT